MSKRHVLFVQKHNGAYREIASGEMTPWHRKTELGKGDKIGRESIITFRGVQISLKRTEYATINNSHVTIEGDKAIFVYELGAFEAGV